MSAHGASFIFWNTGWSSCRSIELCNDSFLAFNPIWPRRAVSDRMSCSPIEGGYDD